MGKINLKFGPEGGRPLGQVVEAPFISGPNLNLVARIWTFRRPVAGVWRLGGRAELHLAGFTAHLRPKRLH